MSAFCRFVVAGCRQAVVAAGFAPARAEIVEERPRPHAEAERAPVVPPVAMPAASARGTASPFAFSGQGVRAGTANPAPGVGGGWAAPVFPSAGGFAPTDARTPTRTAAVRSRAVVAAAPSAGPASATAGQDLNVDNGQSNSPYPVTTSATFDSVSVGTSSVGVINQTAGTLTVSDTVAIGATGNGPYNLSKGTLSTGQTEIGYAGNGIFNQTGGTTTVSSVFCLYLGQQDRGQLSG